jgi:membrane dipeptidase
VDVSQISDEAFWQIMEITEKPVIASHSNSRSVFDVSRNLTDDMFRAICQTGGVAGLNLYDGFIGEQSTIDMACDHVLHFLEMDPAGKHIALGADLDGCDELTNGFEGVQSYPVLTDRMLARGISEPLIHNIFWNNALGVMEQCCM